MSRILVDLLKLADQLDSKGLKAEADLIDRVLVSWWVHPEKRRIPMLLQKKDSPSESKTDKEEAEYWSADTGWTKDDPSKKEEVIS